MINKSFILIFLLLLIVVPAAAVDSGNYTSLSVYNANTGSISFEDVSVVSYNSISDTEADAITELTFSGVRPGTYDLTLTQANGYEHSGQIIYETSGILGSSGNWTLTLDGYSHSWSGINVEPLGKIFLGTYAQNIDTNEKGLIIVDGWIGNTILGTVTGQYNCVFAPESTIDTYPIIQVDVSGTDNFNLLISYGDYESVTEEIANNDLSFWDYIGNLFSFVGDIAGILFAIMAAFKFIIIDHFFQIIVFYEVLVMAYAAGKSRDIFSFGKKVIRYNKALFEAILGFIKVIVGIFHYLIDSLKPT